MYIIKKKKIIFLNLLQSYILKFFCKSDNQQINYHYWLLSTKLNLINILKIQIVLMSSTTFNNVSNIELSY